MTTRAWARRARSAARSRKARRQNSLSSSASSSASSKLPAKRTPAADARATTEPTGYVTYGEFVKDELAAQDARKASFEQRGQAVIMMAGTLVTLLFTLAALSTNEADTFTLPHAAHTWLLIGLGLFFASALAALVTNAPLTYQAVPVKKVRERLERNRAPSADAATKSIALTRLEALEAAKAKNTIKGRALATALGLEALAVGCIAVAVAQIL